MKKFINQIENVELEMLEGIAKAHPDHLKKLPDFNVLVRAEKKEGKVALISGVAPAMSPHTAAMLARACWTQLLPVQSSPPPLLTRLKALSALSLPTQAFC